MTNEISVKKDLSRCEDYICLKIDGVVSYLTFDQAISLGEKLVECSKESAQILLENLEAYYSRQKNDLIMVAYYDPSEEN